MIVQLAIAILGAAAVWMSQSPNPRARRYAPVVGLAAQPFWIVATFEAEQWGMFALAFVYSAAWARGIVTQASGR